MATGTPLYIFQGSNIGPLGVLNDTVNVPELFYTLQKKAVGVPNTVPDLIYSSEFVPSVKTQIPNSFPFIHQTKIYGQSVPTSNPILSAISPLGDSIILSSDAVLDTVFVNSNYTYFGCNMIPDLISSRYYSSSYPYIAYYSNLLLSPIVNNKSKYNNTLYSNFATTYAHPLLQNSISQRYDITYYTILKTNNGTLQISPGDGYWNIDNDTGILMFYDSNTTVPQVNASNPPRISFFRYEGLFGDSSVAQMQYI